MLDLKMPRRAGACRLLALVASMLAGCGGEVVIPASEGGTGASTGTGGGGSASTGSGAGGEGGGGGGWTDCTSPEGYAVCGGANACPKDSPECHACIDPMSVEAGGIAFCSNKALSDFGSFLCWFCPDGDNVCLMRADPFGPTSCVPYDLGVLYQKGGAANLVRHVDYGLWTGQPVAAPTTCPSADGITLCGGACGGCPVGQRCTGRSHLHPYSFCVPYPDDFCSTTMPCKNGFGCFIYSVEPEAQPIADANGYCMPLVTCQKAAVNLPGGGKCLAQ